MKTGGKTDYLVKVIIVNDKQGYFSRPLMVQDSYGEGWWTSYDISYKKWCQGHT